MTHPSGSTSPIDQLLSEMERSIRLTADREVDSLLGPLEGALRAYRSAVEASVARTYATAHSLRSAVASGPSRAAAATRLLDLVLALPEARGKTEQTDAGGSSRLTKDVAPQQASPEPLALPASEPASRTLADVLPKVAAACREQKLVIIGALAGRKRDLPEPLASATEWLDTSDGGSHAVGNLPARIRQARVLAVVLCEQAVSHMHAEPVVAAARAAGIPVGFAGKGGNASIARALRAIEQQL